MTKTMSVGVPPSLTRMVREGNIPHRVREGKHNTSKIRDNAAFI